MGMHLAIIGSGRMGATLGRHVVRVGHEALLANSRGPESLQQLVAELGERARALIVHDAILRAEVVFLAIPYSAVPRIAAEGEPWDGKVVVDLTNYYPQSDGEQLDPGGQSTSSLVARRLDGAHVVKAFNTIWWRRLAEGARPRDARGRLALPVAGDDDDAKQLVMALVDEIGFAPVDAGTLADGKRQEPGTPVYNEPLDAAGVRDALARAGA
jgi:predicted dinucleotide-binding enzyme